MRKLSSYALVPIAALLMTACESKEHICADFYANLLNGGVEGRAGDYYNKLNISGTYKDENAATWRVRTYCRTLLGGE